MSRYDGLGRMREAKFAAKAAEPVRRDVRQGPVTKPVTKLPITKPISVTKPADVTERPLSRGQAPNTGGRPTIGDKPMTPAERMRRYRARRRAQKAST